jgi:hypothetical protein
MGFFVWLAAQSNDPTLRIGYLTIVFVLLFSQPVYEAVFGKKSDPAQLAYRGNLLTAPLQDIHRDLDFGLNYVETAIQSFDFHVEHAALLDILKKDDPQLVKAIMKLKQQVTEIAKLPYTEEEAIKVMGGKKNYDFEMQTNPRNIQGAVRQERILRSSEIRESVDDIKQRIQKLITKYGGA